MYITQEDQNVLKETEPFEAELNGTKKENLENLDSTRFQDQKTWSVRPQGWTNGLTSAA